MSHSAWHRGPVDMGGKPEFIQLSWDRSLVSGAVEWLLDGGDQRDLSDVWVLLPTRQAGRRLREALAWACREQGGMFPPRTGTPFQLLNHTDETVVPEVACVGHWMEVLAGRVVESCPSLFPALPAQRDFGWRRKMAETLHALRGTLLEAGWDCAQVAESDHCEEEPARWRDLARLESAYRKRLGQAGRMDWHDARRHMAEAPDVGGAQRIVVLGVTDISSVIAQALERLAASGLSVQIVGFGPAEGLDDRGRPRPDFWNTRPLPLQEEQLISALDERTQAEAVVGRLKPYQDIGHERVAVGVADPAVLPQLERQLADESVAVFNPDGQPYSRTALYAFLQALQRLLQQPSFAQAAALLRLPDIWPWARGDDEQFNPTRLLSGLDEMHKRHLPASLEDATRLQFEGGSIQNRIVARGALRRLAEALRRLEREPLGKGLADFLNTVFAGRDFCEGHPADKSYLEMARTFMERLREWESAMVDATVPTAEALALLLDSVGNESVISERRDEALEIQGWLELAWEDAPHLIVAGCNEGHLPQSVVGDRFLPERLRARLGLTTNDERLARDIYLMELLHASRAEGGRVDLILGRQRANGDPIRPSRVLLRCPDDELPARVERLFQPLPTPNPTPAWTLPWKLDPCAMPPLDRLSVTAFRSFLACPYRFYLRHVLKMESIDTSKRELDALDFGSLVHQVVEDFGRDEAARELHETAAIHDYFTNQLRTIVETRYGTHPPLPIQIQADIAERRLFAAAVEQAEQFAVGWRIIDTEFEFNADLNGLMVRGRIDRVERHVETGAMRVLDYKTSGKAASPMAAHTKKPAHDTPDYALVEVTDKGKTTSRRWVDLQLPLYYWAKESEAGAGLQLGYFNLPSIGADTGVQLFDAYNPDIHAAAMDCAAAIVKRVRSGEFWPAREKVSYDEFSSILFGQVDAAAEVPRWGEMT